MKPVGQSWVSGIQSLDVSTTDAEDCPAIKAHGRYTVSCFPLFHSDICTSQLVESCLLNRTHAYPWGWEWRGVVQGGTCDPPSVASPPNLSAGPRTFATILHCFLSLQYSYIRTSYHYSRRTSFSSYDEIN